MNRLELFNNLVVMAAVDGKIVAEEAAFLAERATRWGISEKEAQEAIQNATAAERQFTVPGPKEERLTLLREIVKMMVTDGEMAASEKALCASAATAMNIEPDEFKQLLASMMKK